MESVNVVEKGGLKLKDILCSKNLNVRKKHVGVRWGYETCKDRPTIKVYEGKTGRSARLRGAEHLKQLENKSEKSVLFKHKMAVHQHEEVKFKMEITGKFKDALSRQANEAIRISMRPNHELLNSKSEFNHPPTARVVVERKNKFTNPVCGTAQPTIIQ